LARFSRIPCGGLGWRHGKSDKCETDKQIVVSLSVMVFSLIQLF
jgi:hypothetical protein